MRRLSLGVWDVDECRYDSGIGHPSGRLAAHPDEHRPKGPVLLAVDQELGEGPRRGIPPLGADGVGPVEIRQHEYVEQLGAGIRT
jgi:hypothetical protein